MGLPMTFAERFSSFIEYRGWLRENEVKIVSVVVFNNELVVTYTLS